MLYTATLAKLSHIIELPLFSDIFILAITWLLCNHHSPVITYDFVQYLPNGQSQAFVLLTSLLFGEKFGFYVSLPVTVAKTKHQIVPAKNTTFFWHFGIACRLWLASEVQLQRNWISLYSFVLYLSTNHVSLFVFLLVFLFKLSFYWAVARAGGRGAVAGVAEEVDFTATKRYHRPRHYSNTSCYIIL